MNTNLVHNILNVVIAFTAAATAFLLATGCVTLPNGNLSCEGSWINPAWTTAIVAGLGLVKTFTNIIRDGFKGLVKEQPPVR